MDVGGLWMERRIFLSLRLCLCDLLGLGLVVNGSCNGSRYWSTVRFRYPSRTGNMTGDTVTEPGLDCTFLSLVCQRVVPSGLLRRTCPPAEP